MIAPFPNCFSIWLIAVSIAFCLSTIFFSILRQKALFFPKSTACKRCCVSTQRRVPSSIFFFAAKGASCIYPPENPLSFCEKTIFGSSGSLAVIIPYSFVGCNRFARKSNIYSFLFSSICTILVAKKTPLYYNRNSFYKSFSAENVSVSRYASAVSRFNGSSRRKRIEKHERQYIIEWLFPGRQSV